MPGRERDLLPAETSLDVLEQHAEGLVALSGCARHGLGVVDANGAARLARAFAGAFYVELQRPYERGDVRRNARLQELAETLRVPTVATGDVHAHHLRRARLQDALVAIRNRTSLDGCERERRGNHESVLLSPAEMLERLPRDAALRTREVAERCVFDLTQELGYRYPDFSDGVDPADVQLRAICDRAFEERYAERERPQAPRARAARRRARADRAARPRRVLPAPLGGARARARVRARGARPRQPAACAAAGPRARLERRLDRLLPDGPLARRSGRGGALARALHQRRDGRRARHRPRLPARHPREADRPRHRAVRPRARSARRDLRDLPQPRRDPRRRQGARAAVRGARAARARHRRLGRDARRRGARRRPGPAHGAALGRVPRADARDRRAAAPHQPAPGRHGHLDASADRPRARCSRRRWPAARSASGTRTAAATPAS